MKINVFQKDQKFQRWEGGPSPATVLPAKPGLNRGNWDLRRQHLPAIPNVFVFGDYRGHLVAPGAYTLRLCTEKDTLTQSCLILPDPRIQADQQDYKDQQALLLRIENAVKDVHQSVNQLRKVKEQLALRLELLEGKADMDQLLEILPISS